MDLVANSSRCFVFFFVDGRPQLAPQFDESVLELAGVRSPLGKLAGVLRVVVDVFKELKPLLENAI